MLLYNKAEEAMRDVEKRQRDEARKARRRAARAAATAASVEADGSPPVPASALCPDEEDEVPFERIVSTERELPPNDLFETERVARRTITKVRVMLSAGNVKFVNRPYARVESMLLESPLATPIYEKAAKQVEMAQRARRLKEIQDAVAGVGEKKKGKGGKVKG
jgi:hypothetical protein